MLDFFRAVPKKRKVKIKGKTGIIFNNPSVGMRRIFYVATVLLLTSAGYLVYLYIPLLSAIYRYKFTPPSYKTEVIDTHLKTSQEYWIQIPKIMALSKVVENVSPFDSAEYKKVLKNEVVAQAAGSDPPGSGVGKMTYIFAHSTEEGLAMVSRNAVFYLLGELKPNDVIYLAYKGQDYSYRVYETKIISASDVAYLKYTDPLREVLILQTCWPIGTDWQRLLVLAERSFD